ncbi:hypothetical protein BBJ29_002816 [Phytophthora kernoviae]|uniref:HSF-type DNA-binding domain-containing protein n=1 Tax=Phytophthora kernoviae TaxID=325452 RepID=A0A3F2RQ15_9STRA|nr:hypothetical protein BBJ29_002816 [Phytophthora kernoviae]RLN61996.1 hypothetical protein BBP00_00005043 [Phytophthora kernoviae]
MKSSSSSPGNSNANSPKEVAPFLKSLRRMLEDEADTILRWTPNGRAFEIHDMEEMMATVLPKYFKHCKYTSFQRQLNYFNFRKWTKSKAVVCTFSNDFFLRDQPELAWRITRKKSLHSSPHALPKYRSALSSARVSAMPYWKKPRTMMLPSPHQGMSSTQMLLNNSENAAAIDGRRRLPFPSPTDTAMMTKEHDLRQPLSARRFYGCLNVSVPSYDSYGRSFDLSNGSTEQTEPLDWIDCLLPPADETYMCMYPSVATVTPYPMHSVSTRKCFDFIATKLRSLALTLFLPLNVSLPQEAINNFAVAERDIGSGPSTMFKRPSYGRERTSLFG